MKDIRIEQPDTIREIIHSSSRLRYLLCDQYGVAPQQICAVRLDGDNFKIDVHTQGGQMLRFKAKGFDHVLRKDPESGMLKLEFDPALAQAVYEIISDYT